MADVPLCCREVEEPPCEQHVQQARVLRNQGLRSRDRGGRRAVGEPGTAKPAKVTGESR